MIEGKCFYCGSDTSEQRTVERTLTRHQTWHQWADREVGTMDMSNNVLMVKETAHDFDFDSTPIFMVFYSEALGKYYKKLGSADSYGTRSWEGALTEVQPKTKEVVSYE